MSAPSLAEVQRWFKARVQPAAGQVPPQRASTTLLNPQRETPGEERLAVYAGGYVTRLYEALAEVYEAVHHVLGDAAFADLSHAYAQRHPSHDYNLSFAGRELPAFLNTSTLTARLAFLPDLATLEWQICMAFHAAEHSPVDPSRLNSFSLETWARTRLIFQPSVSVIASPWPILDIWQARTQPREAINIELRDRPQRVLIFRQALEVRCELLDEAQALVLGRLLAGDTLERACQKLSAQRGDHVPAVAAWFSAWLRAGLVTDYETNDL